MASKFEEDNSKKEKEYEIQLYNFPLKQLKLEHRLMVKLELKNVIEAFTNKVLVKLKNEQVSNEIRKISDDMIVQIFNTLEPNFNEFDHIVDRCLKIPNNVSLPENNLHNEYFSVTEEYLIKDVEDMEKTYAENQLMIAALEAEIDQYKSIARIVEKENKIVEELQEDFRQLSSTFQDTLNFDAKK